MFWCGPCLQHIRPSRLPSSPGADTTAWRHRQRRTVRYMVQVDLVLWEHCHQQQQRQDGSPGALPAKQARYSPETIWSPTAGADREQDATPGHSQGKVEDQQEGGTQVPPQLPEQSPRGPGRLVGRRWAYSGQRGLVRSDAFACLKASFGAPPASTSSMFH